MRGGCIRRLSDLLTEKYSPCLNCTDQADWLFYFALDMLLKLDGIDNTSRSFSQELRGRETCIPS